MATFLIITLACVCALLPCWLGHRYGLVPLTSPMHLLGYFCFFGFTLKVCAIALIPEAAFYRQFVATPWALQTGALYLSGFVLLMCLGYRLAVRETPRKEQVIATRLTALRLGNVLTLLVLSVLVTALTVAALLHARGGLGLTLATLEALNSAKQIAVNTDGVGATLAGLKTLFILPKLAFVIVIANALITSDIRQAACACSLAALLVVIALVSGDRFELVELMLMTAAVYGLVGGMLRIRSVIAGAIGFAAIFAVSAFMTELRGADGGLWRQMIGSTYFLDINTATLVANRVTQDQYLMGESYLWWSFGWVPRAYWPDKPAIDLGVFLKSVVLGLPGHGAFNVTGPGEAFINFGWAGLLVGFVLGWAYRRIEVWLLQPERIMRSASFVFYPLIFLPFVQATLQSSFSSFVVGAAAQTLLLWPVVLFFWPKYQRVGQAGKQVYHVT